MTKGVRRSAITWFVLAGISLSPAVGACSRAPKTAADAPTQRRPTTTFELRRTAPETTVQQSLEAPAIRTVGDCKSGVGGRSAWKTSGMAPFPPATPTQPGDGKPTPLQLADLALDAADPMSPADRRAASQTVAIVMVAYDRLLGRIGIDDRINPERCTYVVTVHATITPDGLPGGPTPTAMHVLSVVVDEATGFGFSIAAGLDSSDL